MRDRCARCGAVIKPRPVAAEETETGWWERYECRRGHSGIVRWEHGRTSYEGAVNPALGGSV